MEVIGTFSTAFVTGAGGMFVGVETEDTDRRTSASDAAKQGDISVALQIADLKVIRDDRASSPTTCER